MRIFLTGYMASGKTTLGKAYARACGLSFIDLDWYIEERMHSTIRDIFATRGEDGFRQLERKMLLEVAEFENVIVACGGGTPCFFDNMEFMNAAGKTVYLQVSVDELAARLETCRHTRPVLKNRTGEELKNFIAESLQKRLPFYEKAQMIFPAETMLTYEDIGKIVDDLKVKLGI